MKSVLAIFMMVLLATDAFCEDDNLKKPAFAVTAGAGFIRGHTTYQIGGYFEGQDGTGELRFPISELEFPLDVAYGSLGAQLGLADRLEIAGSFKKNLSVNAGELRDRDWGILYLDPNIDWWTDPDSLDISSVSDTKVDALVAEISARLYADPWPYKKTEVTLYLGGKYIYQNFDFTASNLDQWSPSLNDHYGFDVGHDRISGEVLTYEVTKNIPALIAGLKLAAGPNVTFDLTLGYSWFVTVKDEDHHLLRSLVTKAECDGDAALVTLTGEVMLSPQYSLHMIYDYTTIDTQGKETQYHGQENIATIDQKNFSDVHMYEITMTFRF
jgi:hypothetical protein